MEILYTGKEYAEVLSNIAKKYQTYYAWGAFGAPANDSNKSRYKVPGAPSGSFLFDCSGFAYKAIPWGWCGDYSRTYGGATYKKAGFEALETNNILNICSDVSDNFQNIQPGEVLYMSGHVGLYIGDGRAVECTSNWTNGCLFSEVSNCGIDTALPYKRTWLKHGKLPFVDYSAQPEPQPTPTPVPDNNELKKALDLLEKAKAEINEAEDIIRKSLS